MFHRNVPLTLVFTSTQSRAIVDVVRALNFAMSPWRLILVPVEFAKCQRARTKFGTRTSHVSISVSMPACHAGELGSIPRRGSLHCSHPSRILLLQNTMLYTIHVVSFAHALMKDPLETTLRDPIIRTIHEHSEQARSELRSGGDVQQTGKQVHVSRKTERRRVFTQRVHQDE